MSNSLVYGAITIPLPTDLNWSDEFTWKPIEEKKTYSVTGALLTESKLKLAGRPITLQSIDAESGWISRATVKMLWAAAQLPGQQFTLTFRGDTYTVAFDHETGPMEAPPSMDYSDPSDSDFCTLTLRFFKV